jgi:hypothetical protein
MLKIQMKILELKSIILERKNSLDRPHSRFAMIIRGISELEDR